MSIEHTTSLKIYQVLIKPLITDKSYKITEKYAQKYAFLVQPWANKLDIKNALEAVFSEVKVGQVKTLNRYARTRSYKGNRAIRHQKIAYITLKSGIIKYDN